MPALQHDDSYYNRPDCFCRGRALSDSRAARLSSRFETRIRRRSGCAADCRRFGRLVAGMVWFIFTTGPETSTNKPEGKLKPAGARTMKIFAFESSSSSLPPKINPLGNTIHEITRNARTELIGLVYFVDRLTSRGNLSK